MLRSQYIVEEVARGVRGACIRQQFVSFTPINSYIVISFSLILSHSDLVRCFAGEIEGGYDWYGPYGMCTPCH